MTTLYDMTAEMVDADISAGILGAAKREERIARRLSNWAITVFTFGTGEGTSLFVGLHYGAATNDANSEFVHRRSINDSVLRLVPQREIAADREWARNAVCELQRQFGPLPVRVNRVADDLRGLGDLASA